MALTSSNSGGSKNRHLLTGSAMLVVSAAIQAASGALFWLIAARLDDEAFVGSAAKLTQSVLFVTYLAGLGLPVALARYAANRDRDSDVTFTWAVIATATAAATTGLVFVALLHSSATKVLSNWHPVLGPILFAFLTVGAALSMIADVRCMTARRWMMVLVRVSIIGVVRFPLLFLMQDSSHRGLWLFICSTGPVAISGYVAAFTAPIGAGGRLRLSPKPKLAREAIRYSAVNYISTLGYQAPYFALPMIVLASVTPRQYASFNVAWGIVAVAFYVPTALSQALLAEGGREGAHLRSQVRSTMGIALSLMTLGALAAFALRNVITTIYGREDYADVARVLPTMVLAGIPWAITSLMLSEVRILHRHAATVAITVGLTISIVVPALLLIPDGGLAPNGTDGASASWLLGNLVAAVIALAVGRVFTQGTETQDPPLDDEQTIAESAELGIALAEHSA